jgi:hypothetical protein
LSIKEIEQYQEALNKMLKAQYKGKIISWGSENQSNHVIINYSPDKTKIYTVHLQRLLNTHLKFAIILLEGINIINGMQEVNYISSKQI